ncbi:MAG TPA: hypothetical protein VGJ00_04090 [Rhabdochlamydiaceae bacterium]|jgi:hypothetical protein
MIVEAVGVSASSLKPENKELSQRREKAMSDAILLASEQGITDSKEIHKLMIQAYREVK